MNRRKITNDKYNQQGDRSENPFKDRNKPTNPEPIPSLSTDVVFLTKL